MVVPQEQLHNLSQKYPRGQFISSPAELITYEVDAAIDRGQPDAVILVRSSQDVVKAVCWAAEHRVPLIARGAGTGLSGGAVAEHGGVILEFSQFNRIRELDFPGRSVVVEPGVVNLQLDERVKQSGLYYPPDPASGRSATLGGNIAENAGGPHCFKYGVTTNYITGLECVLADGKLVRFGGDALDIPEYDFTGLLTGSEGTLAVVVAAYVRLLRNPPAVKTMMAAFDSVEDAGEAVSAIIAQGLVPATLEMMDQKMMRIIEDYVHPGLPVQAGAALIIEVDGYPESLDGQMEEARALLQAHKAFDIRLAQSAQERERIWFGRKSAAGAMARLSPSYYLLDGTVPRSRLAGTLAAVNQICGTLELRVAYVFHAGDGNLHPFILIEDPSDPQLMERVFRAGEQIMQACVAQGGSITGEHGVGIEKRRFMPMMYSAHELGAMLEIKDIFDPHHLLNPGKIFPPGVQAKPAGEASGLAAQETGPAVFLEPNDLQQACDMLAELRGTGQAVRIRGGGSKSSSLPPLPVTLSTLRLNGIQDYALADLYVTAGAGTRLDDLQAELARDRMWVPLASPWPQSTLGGIFATNFNAPLRMRYGGVRDVLMAAQVTLPDGRTLHAGRPVVKNVAGYDLPKLFVGSHGTLGLLSAVTFKLAPLPRDSRTLIVAAPDLEHALDWGARLLKICLSASALMLCNDRTDYSPAPFTLLYTAEGMDEDVGAELAQARRVLEAAGAKDVFDAGQNTGSAAWSAWMVVAASHTAATGAALLRLGVAPRHMPALLQSIKRWLSPGSFYADLPNGMLYIEDLAEPGVLRRAARALGGYAVLLAGSTPATPEQRWEYTSESMELMRQLKQRWDPAGMFNPGAFVV